MKSNINTILFDLDGTLIDTNELIISTYLHTLDKYYPGKFSTRRCPAIFRSNSP